MKQKSNHLKIVKSNFSNSEFKKSISISIEEENRILDFNLNITKHAFKRLSQIRLTKN